MLNTYMAARLKRNKHTTETVSKLSRTHHIYTQIR